MKKVKKFFFRFIKVVLICYVLLLSLVYFFQEKLIFHPNKLAGNYSYHFSNPYEEVNLKTTDGEKINGLLFKTKNPKGVIYFLHGNSGSLGGWASVADQYLTLNYDVFMIDYRGFGKSSGQIKSEKQFFDDAQLGYDFLKNQYPENKISILGYSIGTGLATYLAANNSVERVILASPYYNLKEIAQLHFPIIPTFLLKYPLETNKYIRKVKAPIFIFHGEDDTLIPYQQSEKLKKEVDLKYYLIPNQGHNGILKSTQYLDQIAEIL